MLELALQLMTGSHGNSWKEKAKIKLVHWKFARYQSMYLVISLNNGPSRVGFIHVLTEKWAAKSPPHVTVPRWRPELPNHRRWWQFISSIFQRYDPVNDKRHHSPSRSGVMVIDAGIAALNSRLGDVELHFPGLSAWNPVINAVLPKKRMAEWRSVQNISKLVMQSSESPSFPQRMTS
jgi:hypothetical protein